MELPFDVKNQIGPCGIVCRTCFLGNGSVANSAKKTLDYINTMGIKEWAPLVPEGLDLNWNETEKTLNWMKTKNHDSSKTFQKPQIYAN